MNMQHIELLMGTVSRIVWGWPLITFLLAVGFYFSYKLKVLKFSRLKLSVKYILERENGQGDISIFAALCTALSATLGTGSIVGMAVAITVGGPGALFWLWVSSIFSFATKYAEGVLAIKYRQIGTDGSVSGGPMYYIRNGLKNTALANAFALFGMITTLIGTGTLVQSNSIVVAFSSFGIHHSVSTIVLTVIVAAVTIGGLQRIAAVSEKIVPLMTIFYIGAAIIVLLINCSKIPHLFRLILHSAFAPKSILGAGAGITTMIAASVGVSRGIYSHEAGLGSAAIAAAAAKTNSPVKQGFVSMAGALLSVIICTMTALVILVTCGDTLLTGTQTLEGVRLTSHAFGQGLGIAWIGKYVVNLSLILFAFTTIIGWNYYGEKCTQYIFGDKSVFPYKIIFILFVAIGPFFKINAVFALADIVMGFMAIPNLIGLIGLRKAVIGETEAFFSCSNK
ncbi:MAG: sodium:alanine symporter family protein [Puniceicoccales bacterium]|jgi:AGCS family alanine or glycine:cation symporter|nr:sodium:alanine symporter family protein [Puniceicoccales bacterium]